MMKKIQKPFNVESAKNGAKVETRDGKSVRIICYDKVADDYPIVALVNIGGIESCYGYTTEGRLFGNEINKLDLVIVEEEENKFKEGEWLFRNVKGDCPWLITAVTSNWYEMQDAQGHEDYVSQIIVDSFYHLWTLKDAKPGDVLICEDGKYPFIFQNSLGRSSFVYCGLSDTDSIIYSDDTPWTNDVVRPATYEEKEMLFKKMEEAGYSWDAKSLTLSKNPKRWRDNEDAVINGYYIDTTSYIRNLRDYSNTKASYNIFATEKQAKSALSMARISQIMANDKRFGGAITNEEWHNTDCKKFVLKRDTDKAVIDSVCLTYNFLAFHTMKQAELFLKENEDLVKDYYMMD